MRTVILLVCLCACAPSDDSWNEINIDNLRVYYQNDMYIDPVMVSFAIQKTQDEFNRLFNENLDLFALINKNELSLVYMPENKTSDRGHYDDLQAKIVVRYDNDWNEYRNELSNPKDTCIDTYYVLAHELLHFIAHRYLGDSNGHRINKLFFYYSDKETEKDTVEYYIYQAVSERCS